MEGEPKLSELMLAGPAEAGDAVESGQEDEIQAAEDFFNEALPMEERVESLKFLIELVNSSSIDLGE
jgi:hypothetical protein